VHGGQQAQRPPDLQCVRLHLGAIKGQRIAQGVAGRVVFPGTGQRRPQPAQRLGAGARRDLAGFLKGSAVAGNGSGDIAAQVVNLGAQVRRVVVFLPG